MRDQTMPLRCASSHVLQQPDGYVVVTSIKRDDGEFVRTAPMPTVKAALLTAQSLAKQAGYILV